MGDFQANFSRPDAGIDTIEGNLAGQRAAGLQKRRQKEQEEYVAKRARIVADSERSRRGMGDKFAGGAEGASSAERAFREATVGLVTAEDFKKAAADAKGGKGRDRDCGGGGPKSTGEAEADRVRREKKAKKKKKKKNHMMSTLSFAAEDEVLVESDADENDVDGLVAGATVKKDPGVDTSFLPDRSREEKNAAEARRLAAEWKTRQEEIKAQVLEITYSYWDGSGHRRTCTVKKGATVGYFLETVRSNLAGEFREIASATAEDLLYVKEDLIIPQDITFYDLIATKARGKSGPLFSFDVHDDLRMGAIDVRVEKDESHPGKIVERRWYDRNKHIFPASRWEIFDPLKCYGKYTIHGGEVND
eukprot:CAMPEP_0194282764 /NCGR_PEP_ID=MMETSP0169-20130528/23823_1 /TAXON_ID=218684 /ORGANISM="Corethron pennatum, Strain L29A3" /LENGTH=361 /DNA_ID=CAMNT_0039028179 /DNA_START=56 /DNA_END=1141 /DNA_ORIENTATION=-